MEIDIKLKYDRQDFMEVYTGTKNDRIISYPDVDKTLNSFLIMLVIWGLSTVRFKVAGKFDFFTFASIGVLCILILLSGAVIQAIKHKKGVEGYLNELESFEDHRLIVTDHTFTLISCGKTYTQEWSDVKQTFISDRYIFLGWSENFIIPVKSMETGDLNVLKKIIFDKVNKSD